MKPIPLLIAIVSSLLIALVPAITLMVAQTDVGRTASLLLPTVGLTIVLVLLAELAGEGRSGKARLKAGALLLGLLLAALPWGVFAVVLAFVLLLGFRIYQRLGAGTASSVAQPDTEFGSPMVVVVALLAGVSAVGWLAGSVYASFYHPVLYEETLAAGRLHIDNLYNVSIASLMQSYGIPSTGLAGPAYTKYHFASHWILGGIGANLGLTVRETYTILYPPLFATLFIYALYVAAERFHYGETPRYPKSRWFLFALVAFSIAGIAPITLQEETSSSLTSLIQSESYLVGLVVGIFLLLAFVDDQTLYLPSKKGTLLRLLVLPALVLVGFLKVSLMAIALAFWWYALFRKVKGRPLTRILHGVVAFAVFYGAYELMSYPTGSTIEILPYMREYVANPVLPWHLIVAYALPILVILGELYLKKVASFSELWERAKRYELPLTELAVFSVLVCAGPTYVVDIPQGSGWYFFNVHKWISLFLLIRLLGDFQSRPITMLWGKLLGIFLLAVATMTAGTNAIVHLARAHESLSDQVGWHREIVADPESEIALRYERIIALEAQGRRLRASADPLPVLALEPGAVELLLLNRDNDRVRGLWSKSSPFVVPAITGLAAADALQDVFPRVVPKAQFEEYLETLAPNEARALGAQYTRRADVYHRNGSSAQVAEAVPAALSEQFLEDYQEVFANYSFTLYDLPREPGEEPQRYEEGRFPILELEGVLK